MKVLSDDEVERLLLHTLKNAGPLGIAEDDVSAIYHWAVLARVGAVLLDKVLSGDVLAGVRDGEVVFGLPER